MFCYKLCYVHKKNFFLMKTSTRDGSLMTIVVKRQGIGRSEGGVL